MTITKSQHHKSTGTAKTSLSHIWEEIIIYGRPFLNDFIDLVVKK